MPINHVYTTQEANELLPWLAGRLRVLATAVAAMRASQGTVESLTRRSRSNGHADLGPALGEAEKTAGEKMKAVRSVLDEIGSRGIQVRDVDTGLVDFPGSRDGVPVWLCWRAGEERVAYWHERDRGFADRKSI